VAEDETCFGGCAALVHVEVRSANAWMTELVLVHIIEVPKWGEFGPGVAEDDAVSFP